MPPRNYNARLPSKPAMASSRSNSDAVRSLPPVHTSIIKSSRFGNVVSGSTIISMTSSREFAAIAHLHVAS
jgi:hypothetical protein